MSEMVLKFKGTTILRTTRTVRVVELLTDEEEVDGLHHLLSLGNLLFLLYVKTF